MLRVKAIFLWSSLLLLLASAGGWAGMDVRQAQHLSTEQSFVPGADTGEVCAAAAWAYSSDALRPVNRPAPAAAKIAGAGGGFQPHTGKGTEMLPALHSIRHAASLQTVLKQWMYTLLTRAEWQQRLALYPKHGFW